ncbi:ICMT-domain-containing protein [Cubamyces menziesii]|uniref:Protein-S-isoprenylcysteine O-methyltransferase n=1 Tax=Trametes cubensis TaxID=1111947 RepID=A0AAD7TVK7_9APHY|nr:ICMT-domain-containing protein [Cubamyces menziesii]KAJ8483479.1 hypothetical protein ONZ51_g4695 [Trametes cubensis]
MSLIHAPGPLLKVPLLLAHTVCTWRGSTPPRPPPPSEELNRFSNPDSLSVTMPLQVWLITVSKWAFCSASLAEIAVLIAQNASSPTSSKVLSFLLPNPGASLRLTPISALACALGIGGGLLRVWCHRTLGKYFTWQVSVQTEHKLVTSGPYAIVRHPSYTAWSVMNAGNFLLLLSKGSYVVESGLLRSIWGKAAVFGAIGYMSFVSYSLIRRVPIEDAVLEKEFGPQWQEWTKRTPYCLIPFVY